MLQPEQKMRQADEEGSYAAPPVGGERTTKMAHTVKVQLDGMPEHELSSVAAADLDAFVGFGYIDRKAHIRLHRVVARHGVINVVRGRVESLFLDRDPGVQTRGGAVQGKARRATLLASDPKLSYRDSVWPAGLGLFKRALKLVDETLTDFGIHQFLCELRIVLR